MLNFNSNNKSWKMYTNTLTSINNDDLLIKPNNTNDLILEVSANNHIILKKGDISYSINTKVTSIDTSFSNVYTTFSAITTSFGDVNTKFLIIDASFNAKLASLSGSIVPLNDICYNLGLSGRMWANAYIRDISVTNISASGNIIPLLNPSGSLGVSTNIWANAFIKDISGLVNINGQPYVSGSGSGTIDLTNVTTNINPSINNSGSLGIVTRKWGNAFIRDLSVGSIDVSVNILPLLNLSISLGLSNRLWGNAYICDASMSSIDVSVNCNPLINNSGSLGSSTKIWGNAYIRDASISSIDVSVNCNPFINNSGSLGSSSKIWGNAFINNINATSITISGSLLPLTNNTGSLGTSSKYWYQICTYKAYISYITNGNSPSDASGVSLLLVNSSSIASQRAISHIKMGENVPLASGGPGTGSRAGFALDIDGKYGWQISVKQDTGFNAIVFNNASNGAGAVNITIRSNGAIATPGTQQNNGSDDRLKHNEIIINNGLAIIDQLVPKFYQKTQVMLDAHYNGDLSGYTWNYESGLIAQELLQIKDISFVVQEGDYYDSNNVFTQRPYSVNYTSVLVYGLAAIKELHTKVKTQESSIVNLQSSILNQQTTLNSLIARIEALENKV